MRVGPSERVLASAASWGCRVSSWLGSTLLAGDVPRLIITPHNAWGSREARQRIVGQLAENATAFLAGAPLRVVG